MYAVSAGAWVHMPARLRHSLRAEPAPERAEPRCAASGHRCPGASSMQQESEGMYHLTVFVHILSAIVWVGGLLTLALVVVPVARALPPAECGALLDAIGRRFRAVGWACILLLLGTGVVIAGERGVTPALLLSGQMLASPFGQLLLAKLVLVAVMIGVSLVHDLALGPVSARLLAGGKGRADAEAARLRHLSAGTARASAILAILVVGLAVALVRGLPW